jgi:predicted DNA-binding transcriptional regulator YafY
MMGTKAEILEPAYLRERFKEVIQEIAAKYQR